MTSPEMTWSEILRAAGMEPELAAAFDLIELRTPNARTVTDLIAALTTVHGDVEGMQGEISSVHERLTALEETDSSLAHLLGEILVELRVLQRRTGEHFPRTERRLDTLTERVDALTTLVDALTVIARGNRESIDRLELIVAQHGRALVALRGEVAELRGEVAELRGEIAELRGIVGEVAELRGEIAELRGEATEQRQEVREILAWVRTQRDGGEPPHD